MNWTKRIVYFLSLSILYHLNISYSYAELPTQIITMQPIADDEITHSINIPKINKTSSSELKCLAQTIYYEARGEGYKGSVAVGNVVINRVKSRHFPNTICKVMHQKTGRMCQFSFICNGHINKPVKPKTWQKSLNIAKQIISGQAPQYAKGALFFHADYVKKQASKKRYTAKIGRHHFYK